MTRCSIGDLAVFVNCEIGRNNGRFVRVLAPGVGHTRPDAPAWKVERQGSEPLVVIYPNGEIKPSQGNVVAYDAELLPIRDPGEDAKDETLLWLPVPSKETV